MWDEKHFYFYGFKSLLSMLFLLRAQQNVTASLENNLHQMAFEKKNFTS